MDCDKIRKLLQEYLDGALPDHGALEIKTHVQSCEGCARELRLLNELDHALRAEPMQEVPGDLAAAVRRRLVQSMSFSWWDIVTAAACVTLALSLFWLGEQFAAPGSISDESFEMPARFFSFLEIGEGAQHLSLSDMSQWASESYESALNCLSPAGGAGAVNEAGGLMLALLIGSALLAIGANAICFHRVRIRHLTPNRL